MRSMEYRQMRLEGLHQAWKHEYLTGYLISGRICIMRRIDRKIKSLLFRSHETISKRACKQQ